VGKGGRETANTLFWIGQRILSKKTTPKQLNTINNASA
jgi:hypothetical protein